MRRCISILTVIACANAQPAQAAKPGEGVLCSAMILSYVVETGRRCYANEDAEFQKRIGAMELRFDDYIKTNGKMTTEQLAKFKREQAGTGSAQFTCDGDAESMYQSLRAADWLKVSKDMGDMLALPGEPTFGDCL